MPRCSAKTLQNRKCKIHVKNCGDMCKIHNPPHECVICYDKIIPSRLFITSCHHYYCKNCIYEWISKNNKSCPTCRGDLTKEEILYIDPEFYRKYAKPLNIYIHSLENYIIIPPRENQREILIDLNRAINRILIQNNDLT
jgi:hypothetical protein